MADIKSKIEAESENVLESLTLLNQVLDRSEIETIELAALGTFIHNIYNGIENILQQIFKDQNIESPTGNSWHKELLEKAKKNNVISESLLVQLSKYLAFRHYFVHSYSFMLKADLLLPLAKDAEDMWKQFSSDISRFC